MHNWHLILLALAAVFEPIASFTERNLVDGRQQCCDRQTDTLLRDRRSSIYGTDRLAKATSPVRLLNNRDETRDDRRSDLRQRDTLFTRRSTERSLSDIRERDARRIPSNYIRSIRVEYRPERFSVDLNRERQVNSQRRERYARNTREVRSEEHRRRILDRVARDSIMRHDDRIHELSERNSLSRDNIRLNRVIDERLVRNSDSQRERMQIRSEDLRRLLPVKDARDNLRRMREDVDRVEIPNGVNRRDIVRQQVNIVRRESTLRVEVRRYLDNNNERREQERLAEERRSLSENSRIIERVRDMRVRENSRDVRRENGDLMNANRRFMTERSDERRQHTDDLRQFRENTDRKVIRERMQMDRRDIRESRLNNNMNTRLDRGVESRRDIERQARDNRDEFVRERRVLSRDTRMTIQRDNRLTDRRSRSLDLRNLRDTRVEPKLSRVAEIIRGRDASRKQVDYRAEMETRERDAVDTRFRHVETTRNRDMMFNKIENENEAAASNWQYIFYTLQAAYLCGLFMQLMLPNPSEKSKIMKLRWWPLSYQTLVKVD